MRENFPKRAREKEVIIETLNLSQGHIFKMAVYGCKIVGPCSHVPEKIYCDSST